MVSAAAFDKDYATFVQKVRRLVGIDLNGYKPEQMRRRLLALAARHGATSLSVFAGEMERNPDVLAAFKNFFTINVSEFLRDTPRWDELAGKVLADLQQHAGRKALKVWRAGCSYGAEPYSLAILLEEVAPAQAHAILATDIDETILARARAATGHLESDLRHVSPARRSRFFNREVNGNYSVKPGLRAKIRFVKHDLLGPVPERDLDLIVCRNVVIYFTEDAKRALYQRMFESLRPGGVLFVGGTEVVSGARELGFEPILTSFYRKRVASAVLAR